MVSPSYTQFPPVKTQSWSTTLCFNVDNLMPSNERLILGSLTDLSIVSDTTTVSTGSPPIRSNKDGTVFVDEGEV
jgi:hypothetical protein